MSEELGKEDELNKKKKPSAKKIEIIEQYKYIPEENVELIMDKPSESLHMIDKELVSIKPSEQKKDFSMKKNEQQLMKSNKELYESYINELKNFSLSLNNEVIYDSSIDKSKESPIRFENDYFVLYGKKYSYNGLKIQKINKR